MNLTHLHLILNHFPIIGTLMGSLFLLYGILRKNDSLQKISLATIVTMAIIAIPVFLTGEPAEESVENITGISEAVIEPHEEAAELAFWVMEITAVICLASLIFSKINRKMAQVFTVIALIASFASFALMARTGYLGGKIRHTELNGNIPISPAGKEKGTTEGDNDD
jgi:uncharacterized membrane protein